MNFNDSVELAGEWMEENSTMANLSCLLRNVSISVDGNGWVATTDVNMPSPWLDMALLMVLLVILLCSCLANSFRRVRFENDF